MTAPSPACAITRCGGARLRLPAPARASLGRAGDRSQPRRAFDAAPACLSPHRARSLATAPRAPLTPRRHRASRWASWQRTRRICGSSCTPLASTRAALSSARAPLSARRWRRRRAERRRRRGPALRTRLWRRRQSVRLDARSQVRTTAAVGATAALSAPPTLRTLPVRVVPVASAVMDPGSACARAESSGLRDTERDGFGSPAPRCRPPAASADAGAGMQYEACDPVATQHASAEPTPASDAGAESRSGGVLGVRRSDSDQGACDRPRPPPARFALRANALLALRAIARRADVALMFNTQRLSAVVRRCAAVAAAPLPLSACCVPADALCRS